MADELQAVLRQLGGKRVLGRSLANDHDLPGGRRFYAEDPWGNRLEFVEVLA